MPIELELKCRINPRDIARLHAHPLFRQGMRSAPRKLYSVYYDTPELDLWRAGVSLRLRRAGKDWTQTVNCGGGVVSALHQRQEFESRIKTPFPDFTVLAQQDVAAHFAAVSLRTRLKPVFVAEITRTSTLLRPKKGVAIQASVDVGTIKSGDATEPLCEVELEWKAGPAWKVNEAALQLIQSVPMVVDPHSKAQRGMALHQGASPEPCKAQAPVLTADLTTNHAFVVLAQSCLTHYLMNQDGMLQGRDPEYLHQMRVALRRLRSVLAAFGSLLPEAALEQPVAEIHWLAQTLGKARNWDVFADETLPLVARHNDQHTCMARVEARARTLRRAANAAARRVVTSTRGQSMLLALGSWLSAQTWLNLMTDEQRDAVTAPVPGFAREVLARAQRRVRKRGRHFSRLTAQELHRLRIAVKKLRYAAEFFSPLYDASRAGAYAVALARLQDVLGAWNDAEAVKQLVLLACRGVRHPRLAEARGMMLGWSNGIQDASRQNIRRAWKKYLAAQPFWSE
jgi:inorganic triphosphatase YgiF